MLFSQRNGYKPVRESFQVESMDEQLRNGLWNALDLYVLSLDKNTLSLGPGKSIKEVKLGDYHSGLIWSDFFKRPLSPDIALSLLVSKRDEIYELFFMQAWFEVYDLLEFSASKLHKVDVEGFKHYCNTILEREMAGYRFVGNAITQITAQDELISIEEAISKSNNTDYISKHLRRSLELLSDRKTPDYRNSIKESISAVEALCKQLVGDDSTTLGKALEKLERQGVIELHSSLKEAFKQLYGYTSDAAGIRHAIKDSSTVSFEDAKFMLVTCSAFVNYLIGQASKAGVKL